MLISVLRDNQTQLKVCGRPAWVMKRFSKGVSNFVNGKRKKCLPKTNSGLKR